MMWVRARMYVKDRFETETVNEWQVYVLTVNMDVDLESVVPSPAVVDGFLCYRDNEDNVCWINASSVCEVEYLP